MVLKFAANLNFLFVECSPLISTRIELACKAGFKAVEIPYPRGQIDNILKVKETTGMEIALINIALDTENYPFGLAAVKGREQLFQKHLSETIDFAKLVNCKKIHIMSGVHNENSMTDLNTYKSNLVYAVHKLNCENITALIEPINKYSVPNYFMNCYDKATSIIKEINSDNLKLMLDIFHLQLIRGNISHAIEDFRDIIGHIQIAQVPHRHEPMVPGEIDFKYLFTMLEQSGYEDWIGCEYKPQTNTLDGLKWLNKYNCTT